MKMKFDGPWSLDHGQLRDKDGWSLGSFPVYPNGLLRNGELCAMLPEIVHCLEVLVKRIKETPFDRNEGLKGPMIAEATDMLKRIAAIEQK